MKDLKGVAFSGVVWSTAGSMAKAVVQVAQLVVLARILAPADFGVVAIVNALLVFIQAVAEGGVGASIIHFQKVNQEQRSSLYWFGLIVAFSISALLLLVSGFIGEFYGNAVLPNLICLAALALCLDSISYQLRIHAQKLMQFKLLAYLDVISSVAGFAVAVSFALFGAGVYSLLYSVLAVTVCNLLFSWFFLSGGWLPGFCFKLKEIKAHLIFGIYMVASNLVNIVSMQLDVWVLGRYVGSKSLGEYSIARDLNFRVVNLFNPIATKVALPLMAKVQEEANILKDVYLKVLAVTAAVNFPIYIGLFFFAPELILVLFGEQWGESITLLQYLAVWGCFRALGNPVGVLLAAKGRADLGLKWNIGLLVVFVPSILLIARLGVDALALMYAAAGFVLYWPAWRLLVAKVVDIKFHEYFLVHLKPMVIALFSVWGGRVICDLLGASNLGTLFLGGAFAGFLYLSVSCIFNRIVWFVLLGLVKVVRTK